MWVTEHLLGRPLLDDMPRPSLAVDEEQGTPMGDPLCLLHVVGDDDDRDLLAQLGDGFLDYAGRYGVEGRAGLVHQQYLGPDGEGPGNAQALLLATRKRRARLVEPEPSLVPKPRPGQALLHEGVFVVHLDPSEP